ncbi:putative glycosyltransferase [Burkholderia pseudomallei 576]|nr:putative glycosyltransferase [Burkholderia pseudomallei 576]
MARRAVTACVGSRRLASAVGRFAARPRSGHGRAYSLPRGLAAVLASRSRDIRFSPVSPPAVSCPIALARLRAHPEHCKESATHAPSVLCVAGTCRCPAAERVAFLACAVTGGRCAVAAYAREGREAIAR